MQRGRGGRGDFFGFGDPFAGFGGFGDHRSLMSSQFGKDPFDDPFFTRPFGSMFGPSMLGSSMLGSSMFGAGGSLFGDMPSSGFLEHQAPQPMKSKGPIIQELSPEEEEDMLSSGFLEHQAPQPKKLKGPIIEELSPEEEEEEEKGTKVKKDNPRKHSRPSKEPFIQDPDDKIEERKSKQCQFRSEYNRADRMPPQTRTFSFQSSTVTYGGANGAYYTSSATRRTGGDGVMVEESKEADTTTGKATHKISRGIRDKGHSTTRKLNSDGKVATVQTLRNLNEDELVGFEEAWKGDAKKHLPGWNRGFDILNNGCIGPSSEPQNGRASRGWALPSIESQQNQERMIPHGKTRPNSFNGRI